MTAEPEASGLPVAIVGIGCRFPGGVTDVASLWRLLIEGRDAIGEIPRDRIDLDHYFDARPATPGRIMTHWGGFLDRIEDFDAAFFSISPREAERLDPQQRLMLEIVWEALEDAGQDINALDGSATGVFVGQWLNDFEGRLFADPEAVDFYMTTGSGRYATSGRVSYALGLRGPSLTIDTACSSSLVAVHAAVRSLRSGESLLAIAGGVNIILQPHISIAYSQSRMMAPDGRCKFGDASGDGYVRSEGAGVVVLKPLERALADGDRIYAVIRGSAVNNDGRSSGSMGTPSRIGQEELLRSAYRDAGVAPRDVSYIEAHGTGTRAGDPVELGALSAVLAEGREPGKRARVGSIKTNFGHTEGAAGVAGLIKVALSMHHGSIPPSLHCKELNPVVPWAQAPVEIARERADWLVDAPIGGVSAFGIAGTNAHVVLQSVPRPVAPAPAPAAVSRTLCVLPLSARSAEALRALAVQYAELLSQAAGPDLLSTCSQAAIRRSALDCRAVWIAADKAAMINALRRYAEGEPAAIEGVVQAATPRVAFVVPGQGAQWTGMARQLAAREPVFLKSLQRCDAAARRYVDWSIVAQLALEPGADGYLLDRIDVIQPVLVAMAIAYADWLASFGIAPDAAVGHSMGEVGAAYLAGALDLDGAMRVICRRSALMRQTSGQGAMAMVDLSMADAEQRIGARSSRVSVAVSNSPRSCVISGDPFAVQEVIAECERDGIFCRLVKVDVASHSPQMEEPAAQLRGELQDLRPMNATLPIYSTVLARSAAGLEFDASYWGRNMRQPVRFTDTVNALLDDGVTVFVELGPHPVLLPAIQQTAQPRQSAQATTIAFGRREEPEHANALAVIAGLWVTGVPIDWKTVAPVSGAPVSLPLYPWQRERFWSDAAYQGRERGQRRRPQGLESSRHPLLGLLTAVGGSLPGCLWETDLTPARDPALLQHCLHGVPVLAASVYLELAFGAQREREKSECLAICNLRFENPLHVVAEEPVSLQLQWLPRDERRADLAWHSPARDGWVRNASAAVGKPVDRLPDHELPATIKDRCPVEKSGAEIYADLEARGAGFGPALRCVLRAWTGAEELLAELQFDSESEGRHGRRTVPAAFLDACFQLAVSACPPEGLWMPTRVAAAMRWREPRGPSWIHVRRGPIAADGSLSCSVLLSDVQGPVVALCDVRLEKLGAGAAIDPRQWVYDIAWQEPAAAAKMASVAATHRRWLILANRNALPDDFSAALRSTIDSRGDQYRLLQFNDAWTQQSLQEELLATRGAETGAGALEVLDLRALDLRVMDEQILVGSLHGLAELVRAVSGSQLPVRVHAITRNARALQPPERERLIPAQAAVWGVGAAMAAEHGDFWAGCIDLDAADPNDLAARAVIEHVLGSESGDVAIRGGKPYLPRLRQLPDAAAGTGSSARFRVDASYLLTGGLGGVGIEVARWMAQQGARRLVVLGRTQLPVRARWSDVDCASAVGVAVAEIRSLEALGSSVHYAAVDVGDEQALRCFLKEFAIEAWPRIRGVIHAAGVAEDRLIGELDRDSWLRVLHGKAIGAWNLHQQLPDTDFFALFSSVRAILPEPGQASYAAANSILDALAQLRQSRHVGATPGHDVSIGWGVWAGLGLAKGATGKDRLDQLEKRGIHGFSPAAGLSVLGELLGRDVGHAVVQPIDWAEFARAHAGREPPLVRNQLASVRALDLSSAESLPAAALSPEERRKQIEQGVRDAVGRVLKLPAARINARKPLGAMGLSSLLAMELRNQLEVLMGRPLSATLAWNYPTVDALVGFLAGNRPNEGQGSPIAVVPPSPEPVELGELAALSDDDAALLLRRPR